MIRLSPLRAHRRPPRLFNAALLLLAAVAAGPAWAEPPVRIAVLGDSLAAGYGLSEADAFPARLEEALRAEGLAVEVLNAGVSGDTTAGGLARLDWTLADRPDAVIVELGANDALRGLSPEEAYANLDAILARLGQAGLPVLLAGMLAPPNMGAEYETTFNAIYPRLAEKHGVPLYPFFLDGVAARRELNQPDGIHPNAEGVAVMVRGILPAAKDLAARARAS